MYYIKIEVTKNNSDNTIRIVGYVNGRDIISISNYILGNWTTGSSTCLPSDIEESIQYVECMRQAFDTAKSYGASCMR